jgi:type I restriction enzyme S subunit
MTEEWHPPTWDSRPLGEIASITLGGTPATSVPSFWNGDVPWMSSGDIHRRRIKDVPGRISTRGLAASNATLVSPPAVAVALAGQGRTRGTAALVTIRLCTNQSVALIKGKAGLAVTRFLFHALDRRYEELRARSSGGGRAGLSRRVLAEVPIALPPVGEQGAMATVLDSVDEAMTQTEELIAKLTLLQQGLTEAALCWGIEDSGRLRDAEGAVPDGCAPTHLGPRPRGWTIKPLWQCLVGKAQNGIYKPENAIGSGTLLVGQTAITDSRVVDVTRARRARISPGEIQRYGLKNDDLLMSRVFATVDGVGQPALVTGLTEPAVYESNMMRIRGRKSVVDPFYLFLVLRSSWTRRYIVSVANSSNQTSINQSDLHDLPIPVPPLEEQRRIMGAVRAIDDRRRREESALAKLRLIRSGLSQDLLSGRVGVRLLLARTST